MKTHTITVTDETGRTLLSIETGAGQDHSNVWARPAGPEGAKEGLRVLVKFTDRTRAARHRIARQVRQALKDENDFTPLLEAARALSDSVLNDE